jgi:hypothetical protein
VHYYSKHIQKELDYSRSKMEFRSGPGETVATRTLETTAAAVEVTAGLAIIADPAFVVHLLIGASLSSGGIAVGGLADSGFCL